MTEQEAIKLMLNEIECINTADRNECNRDCASCSLVKGIDELLEAYSTAIKALEEIHRQKTKVGMFVTLEERAMISERFARLEEYQSIGTVEEFTYSKRMLHMVELASEHIEKEKQEIRAKAIDEFVSRLEKHTQENWIDHQEYGITWSDIERIAEQIKAGGSR